MAVLDDAASIKRLKAVFQEHLDKHDADIGLTPYADDGISAAPNQLYTTSAPAPVGPPAQAYAGGGEVDDLGAGRFTRTPAERRIVRERAIDRHVPVHSDEWDRVLAHSGNPLSYGLELLSRLDNRAGAAAQGPDSIYTKDKLLEQIAPNHELGDKYGLPGRFADAAQTVANVLPGLGAAERGLAGVLSPTFSAAAHAPAAIDRMLSWRPEGYPTLESARGYGEGGRVSRLIKQITNTRGAFQGERATKAADLANLDRISSNGVLDLFDSDKSSLLTAMPPAKFEDYATRLPITARGVVPYPRFENYPGRSMPRWQDQTYDNYLDKLAQSMKTGPQDRRAYAPGELWMYKNPEDMTEIEGHEGRHRMAALARLGDESGLVHLRPVNPGELNMRPDMEERINDLKQKYFPQGADTPIVPQFTLQSRYNFKGEPQMGKFDITNRDALPLPAAPFKEGGNVLRKLAKAFTEQAEKVRGPDSGFSWHPQTGEPSGGYIGSMWPERGQIIPPTELSGPSLQKFYKKNRDLLDLPDHYLGAWHDPESGQIYIDVSKHGGDLNDIAMQARAANQKSIFDLGNFETIDTGGTGAPLRAPPTYGPGFREGGVVNKLARKFLVDPVRERFPGIYQDPDKLVMQAKERFVPDLGKEGPMYSLFGHTRDSLDELSQGKRAAEADAPWREPPYNLSGTARTSPRILTRPNANRLVDTIGAGLEDPAIRGTRSWYEMSPMWERMKQLGASDDEMRNLNNRMSVMSAGSDPKTEINRGFYANWLANNDRLEDFVKYGGVPDEGRGDWFPRDMMGLQGHAYHGTAHVPNLLDNEFTGRLWGKEHKVPTYAAATDPLRPYSDRPIADSHFSRILGYPDVSTAVTDAERKGVMSGTQYSDMVPWFQKNVANRLDMRPRDAQALLWNLGGPQTGVRYIGPSKLEMISNHMDNVAKELGISPDMARDKLLKGEIGGSTAFDAPFKRGGEVENFFNEFQAMNYRKGGALRAYAGGGAVERAARAMESSAFRKWFGKSAVVTPEGLPEEAYRGEHGPVPRSGRFQSRLGSLSFGDADAANIYAENPNNRILDSVAHSPRVTPSFLRIQNPLLHDKDDPFMDMSVLHDALGPEAARDIALRHADRLENTNQWRERLNPHGEYGGIKDYLQKNPTGLGDLYGDAYPFLDDKDVVSRLRRAGYDGAIHGGMGDNALTPEYRIFAPSQARSAISGYARGGPARDPDDVLNYHPLFFRHGGKYKAP